MFRHVLNVCDDMGERLAYMLGITSPKYASEINAYNRKCREDEDRKKREEESFSGWKQQDSSLHSQTTTQHQNLQESHQMHQLDPMSVESMAGIPQNAVSLHM